MYGLQDYFELTKMFTEDLSGLALVLNKQVHARGEEGHLNYSLGLRQIVLIRSSKKFEIKHMH